MYGFCYKEAVDPNLKGDKGRGDTDTVVLFPNSLIIMIIIHISLNPRKPKKKLWL